MATKKTTKKAPAKSAEVKEKKFKVLFRFMDAKTGHIYNVGDVFPGVGVTVTDARINELKGTKNAIGRPLIG